MLALRYLEENKTAENLYAALLDICKEYNISEKIFAPTTDSGADILSAITKKCKTLVLKLGCLVRVID